MKIVAFEMFISFHRLIVIFRSSMYIQYIYKCRYVNRSNTQKKENLPKHTVRSYEMQMKSKSEITEHVWIYFPLLVKMMCEDDHARFKP